MASNDNVILSQILPTHDPHVSDIDVKSILQVVEDILRRSTMAVDAIIPGIHGPEMIKEDKAQTQAIEPTMLDALSHMIDRISSEIAYKCSSGEDGHKTTVSLLNMLSNYSWDAKLVITLAAFALDYGDFWLLTQIYSSNQLAKSMAILKKLPMIIEHSGSLKPKFEALTNLVTAMLGLTRCIVAFKELPSGYISQDVPAWTAARNNTPTAVYWTMRGVLVCAAQISSVTAMGLESGTASMQASELPTLAQKIKEIHDHLRNKFNICNKLIDDKRINEPYEALEHIFEDIHIDNMKVLKALIHAKDDLPPLFDGASKRRVNLDVLTRKNVLLLISSLDISPEELSILDQIYTESRQSATSDSVRYEIVWMPIVDPTVEPWTDQKRKQVESMQSILPWYSVYQPSLIDPTVIRFVKEKWHFRNMPILVVLDPQGKVMNTNAILMMWIWGSTAFPFTRLREEALWKEEVWRLELIVNGIDQTVYLNWIRDEKYIFVYGGDDIEWIRRFTTTARSVARSAGIPLEMLYVGKSRRKERVRRITATIKVEKLSYAWEDVYIWFFWTRLESMLHSKIQLGQANDIDPVTREIEKLLSYDKSTRGCWAVLCRGSEVFVNGHGSKVMPTLLGYNSWKEHAAAKGFCPAFKEYYDVLHAAEVPSCRFEFYSTTGIGRIPENMKCPECFRDMEKYLAVGCCHDREIDSR